MKPKERRSPPLLRRRVTIVALHDLIMAALAFEIAVWLRYYTYGAPQSLGFLWEGTLIFTAVAAIVFSAMGLYRGIWYYASLNDLIAILKATTLAILVFLPVLFLVTRLEAFPRTTIFLLWPLLVVMLAAPRFLYRALKDGNFRAAFERTEESRVPVLLAGVGDAAETFIRQMARSKRANYRVVGIVDDDPASVGRDIRGVRVLGTVAEVAAVIARLRAQNHRPQRLIIASDKFDGARVRELLGAADSEGLRLARLPRLTDFRHGEALEENGRLPDLRPLDVEDLLGRPEKVLDRTSMARMVGGRRVLVTGAGGTIGAELVRQIAELEPALIALLDNSEFNLYTIDLELGEKHPSLPRAAVLGNVRDRGQLDRAFAAAQPELVFHAAAFKHVPLTEANPSEAVMTNVFGTLEVAECCRAHGVTAVVLISTDKAVNPASVMGATKRIAEIICQALSVARDTAAGTRFVTVRFGNVLGSTGSVVPLFEHQLSQGGPLTVTHPDAMRYFMTTREAVELVLQAAAMPEDEGERGKIFVLDMGDPVRIQDLARQMIKLAELNPETDIEITYTGLRAGEKLEEELFHEGEALVPTRTEGVRLAAPRLIDYELLASQLTRLKAAAAAGRTDETLRLIGQLVPEYRGAADDAPRRAVAD